MESGQVLKEALKASAYMQLPDRLRKLQPRLSDFQQADVFGVRERLDAIVKILNGRDLGKIADLGGYSGFFSMSLVDAGLAKAAIVYDINAETLRAGQIVAEQMQLQDKVRFVEQPVSLDFVKQMDSVDSVLCLNLLHHAGSLFDNEIVRRDGWESYANEWLAVLRNKCRFAVLSIGFKGNSKPVCWNVSRPLRPRRFIEIARRAGWSVTYDANADDIQKFGVDKAAGRDTRSALVATFRYRLKKLHNSYALDSGRKSRKRQYYHLFVLE
jgi:hypothetical protein